MKSSLMAKAKAGTLVLALSSLMICFQNCAKIGNIQGGSESFSLTVNQPATDLDSIARNQRFEAAKEVLQRNCVSCHSPSGIMSTSSLNSAIESYFISANFIVPGKVDESKILTKLRNYPGTSSARTMPPTGPLSSADYQALVNWVSLMNSSDNQFACDANEAPSELGARRLTKQQYINAVRSLVVNWMPASSVDSFFTTTAQVKSEIPDDQSPTFSSGDENFSSSHAIGYFNIAEQISDAAVNSMNYSSFVGYYINLNKGTCVYSATTNLNDDCRKTLIRNFTLRAFGRPIEETDANSNNEMASYMYEFALAADTKAGVNAMVFKTLMSPAFLNQLYIDVTQFKDTTYRLSSYAIARRLSLTFMQNLPDETLLAIAASKDLSTESGFLEALTYVSKKMDPSLQVFATEWLRLNQLADFSDTDKAKWALISGGLNTATVSSAAYKKMMVDEINDLVSYIVKNNRPARELMTSNISFARSAPLMKVYGQATPAPTTVTENNAVRFPASERSGLLTRAGMLYFGGTNENLVLRGIHIRKQVLCLTMPDPPANLPAGSLGAPVEDEYLTTRQRYHDKTSSTACAGCHSQINPLGFALSKYNAFGGYQMDEPIFKNNVMVRSLPTDSVVDLSPIGLNVTTQDGVDFSEKIADSALYKKCLTQNFYAFVNGLSQRPTTLRSCAMSKMYNNLGTGGTLQDFFTSAVKDSRFRYRTITGE